MAIVPGTSQFGCALDFAVAQGAPDVVSVLVNHNANFHTSGPHQNPKDSVSNYIAQNKDRSVEALLVADKMGAFRHSSLDYDLLVEQAALHNSESVLSVLLRKGVQVSTI